MLALVVLACGGGGDDDERQGDAAPTTTTSTTEKATTSTTEAEAPAGFEVTEIAAGDQHVCALDPNGAAWCWGYNRMGQLGDGTNEDSLVPVEVAGGRRFTALSAGRYFTCGLDEAGAAHCWGDNSSGAIGDGTTGAGSSDQNRAAPAAVLGGLSFDELVTGQLHVCGRTATAEAWCWGAYPSGQLGNDARPDQTQPSRSAVDLQLVSLAASGTTSCGLERAGAAWCWGNNTFGQLGDGTKTNAPQHVPRPVIGGVAFTTLTLGRTHGCGLDGDGAAWCWGGNTAGQLGDGTVEERLAPVEVAGGHRFASLSGGVAHTCGITDEGEAWCWGGNPSGQLGDGTAFDDRLEPTAVVGGLQFSSLAAGEEYTCGVEDGTGTAWCWGAAGTLGSGADRGSEEPAPVAVPEN